MRTSGNWAPVAGVFLLAAVGGGLAWGQATTRPAEGPASWLATDGKSADWASSTARCRELLGKLKPDDPLLKTWLPNVQDRCQMLRKAGGADYKVAAGIEYVRAMLEDLSAGVEPWKRYAGKSFGYPYWSDPLGGIEVLWVSLPAGYDPGRKYVFFMFHKTGSGTFFDKGKAAGGPGYGGDALYAKVDAICCWSSIYRGAKGRMGLEYELRDAPPALAKDFAIDVDRVFAAGWSDGGFTSLWLGSRYPHLLAGIAPDCANWQYGNVELAGLYNVPTLFVDGWGDGGYVQANVSRWQILQNGGGDAACLFGHHGHSYEPYYQEEEFTRILDWAKTKKRDLWPKRVRYATWNLCWHQAYWFSIQRVVEPLLAARIDAQVKDGNRIEVETWNVAAYKLALSDKLVDPGKPVVVTTNGKESYRGAFRAELPVEVVKLPAGKFAKSADMPDEIFAQLDRGTYNSKGWLQVTDRRWLVVRPSGGDETAQAAMAAWSGKQGKPDSEITDADLAGFNLFIFGGPDVNKLAARIADDLPVKFAPGKFTIGKKVYDGPTQCVKFIHPNPLNPRKYVIVYAANNPAEAARHNFFNLHGSSPWGFREGDCRVTGIPQEPPTWGVADDGSAFDDDWYMFDSNWRVPDQTPLGELTAPFDLAQIQRLRADAIRDATGCDVGLVPAAPPGWTRWKTRLPAGAVTLNDLAATYMFPEYVVTFECKGTTLAGLVAQAAASTVLADQRDPAYEPGKSLLTGQIDPAKTYRVACDGYGYLPLSWSGATNALPALFFWKTPEEFAAGGKVSLPLSNTVLSTVQPAEAMAQYVKLRGKVAPRPTCFDLTSYLLNPRANEFGGCDWLHVGMQQNVNWRQTPPKWQDWTQRYTLNVGLRLADDPAAAPPRKLSKAFREVSLGGKGGPMGDFDFAGLDKKLPAVATARVAELVVACGEGGKLTVVADGQPGAVARAIVVDLRIVNKGAKDLAGVAVLSPTVQMRDDPCTVRTKDFYGFIPDFRTRDKLAAAMLTGSDRPVKMIAPGSGFNSGLMGIRQEIAVKAGATLALPVVYLSLDPARAAPVEAKPASASSPAGSQPIRYRLEDVLSAIRDDVMKLTGGKP